MLLICRQPAQWPAAVAAAAALPAARPAVAARAFSSGPVAAAASNTRWKARQAKDHFSKEAKVRGLKSRAAFKLLEMDAKYRLFQPGQTIVDLGYAPGSWSQVAVERTKPRGMVVGIDLIPAQPPPGVSTIQGNFLSPEVRGLVKAFLVEQAAERKLEKEQRKKAAAMLAATAAAVPAEEGPPDAPRTDDAAAVPVVNGADDDDSNTLDRPSYLTMERQQTASHGDEDEPSDGHLVDVVLSDMSAPWPQTYGFWLNTLSRPYKNVLSVFPDSSSDAYPPSPRMMNTSGTPFRDHAGSMDLCLAALAFACDTLRPGGHFVCKFYQGNEDRALEQRLRRLFARVAREKPESSRKESREAYFVALKRKRDVTWEDVAADVAL